MAADSKGHIAELSPELRYRLTFSTVTHTFPSLLISSITCPAKTAGLSSVTHMRLVLKHMILLFSVLAMMIPTTAAQEIEGMDQVESNHSVKETLDRLEDILGEKGLTVFARINFTRDAQASGLTMHRAELLVFGNPKAGTPMMVETPTVALDLPLKALAWEDTEGAVFLAWNDPLYLAHRHGVREELIGTIAGVRNLLVKAAE